MPDIAIGIPLRAQPDRLKATLASLAANAPNARVILLEDEPHRETAGSGDRFNRLVRATRADFYVLLEAGAIPAPFWLDRLLAAFRRFPLCGIAGPSTNRASNQQCLPQAVSDLAAGAGAENLAASAVALARRFGSSCRGLEPPRAPEDFCFMARRDVVETVGDASGQAWTLDYNIRARSAGYVALWVCSAWVHRTPPDRKAEEDLEPALSSSKAPGRSNVPIAATPETPLVSCIMPTYNRRGFVPQAIQNFLAQDYPAIELIVVDDGSDPVRDLMPTDPGVRYFRTEGKRTIGSKRNIACEHAGGSLIAHWDDDDWYAPERISRQVRALTAAGADICGTSAMYYLDEAHNRAFRYALGGATPGWMAALLYKRSVWSQQRFEDIQIAEDVKFLARIPAAVRLDLRDPGITVGAIHRSNTSPKVTTGTYWKSESPETVRALMRAEKTKSCGAGPRALVSAASGIGDLLRVTPLVGVLARLGFTVDLLLEPDYPEAVQLLDGHPGIADIFWSPSRYAVAPLNSLDGLAAREYDIATFTILSASLQNRVRARRKIAFDRSEWLRHGDSYCVEKVARELGWSGELPRPFALASGRRFNLAPGTVALHPGCKPEWHWKKWHGFDELAAMFSDVVVIGTESDLRNERTYFRREFAWPPNAKNYAGVLTLPDTAALLSQCAALVSNDSGMMHLGTALGIPTFGIFGITSPEREAMRTGNMFPITAQLACEPACREKSWGRSDCEHHLACLKTLTPRDVFRKVTENVTTTLEQRQETVSKEPIAGAPAKKRTTAAPALTVTYHGHVFDASGYGSAARAYVHALHSAGIDLAVADLSRHEPQVRDPLVESLSGRSVNPDFHIFHGIPPIWAREAFRVPNAIAMTVWETDAMPAQWRATLNHALEVWLPCDFNVGAFQPQLQKPVFKLPHAFMRQPDHAPDRLRAAAGPDDFVFYSIFEWQDRKCPPGQLAAYFRAFRDDGQHIFVMKCNPGAAGVAAQTVEEARRVTGSSARVALHCEAWSNAEMDQLHRRGDCYVSLHRGEGWCYPLFDAACRGTPVIATAYSGPLEYLSESFHELVPYTLTSVRQQYAYYNRRMQWADPEIGEASRRMRWVYEHSDEARKKAGLAVPSLEARYAPEVIGAMARERLIDLQQCRDLQRRPKFAGSPRRADADREPEPPPAPSVPPQPIPGDWYDADYFERGIKSNWANGYSWPMFQGLFRDTAAYLVEMLPDANSWLDAGCAKGFLIAALREKGRAAWGFDASPWAVTHAVETARPYVWTADAASMEWDRRVEFTVALDLLSHLTEDQAIAFLSRARAWTSAGLFATIPTHEENTPVPVGTDPSHITLRSRGWWHECFVRSGWRRDSLHRILERACQNHPLAQKMGWQVFLYAPA